MLLTRTFEAQSVNASRAGQGPAVPRRVLVAQ